MSTASETATTALTEENVGRYVPADSGPSFWGPGDRYTFLVTGKQSDGAYFIMEAIVPPGGGPPPHIHNREQESFYLLEGMLEIRMADQVVQARTGDFVHIPAGTVHCFTNTGTGTARMLLIFSPGGIERFFEETLDPVADRSAQPPDNIAQVVSRYVEAAPRHGLQFV